MFIPADNNNNPGKHYFRTVFQISSYIHVYGYVRVLFKDRERDRERQQYARLGSNSF